MRSRIQYLCAGALALTLALFNGAPAAAQDVPAQDAPSPEGHWEGAIQVPGGELGVNVDLVYEGGTWSGDISIPVQQTEDFPLSDIVVEGTRVGFAMAGVPGAPRFDGTISEDGQTISGSFVQGGQNLTFSLSRGQ